MMALWGAALAAGGILVTALAAAYLRRPGVPRWVRSDLVAELIAVVLTGTIGLGLGYLLMTGFRFASGGVNLLDLGAIVGCFAVAVALWHLIAPGRRPEDHAAAATVIDREPTPRPASRKTA